MVKVITIAIVLAVIPAISIAQTSFVVSDIRIEGLQRIAASSVFGLLNVNVGEEISTEDVANIIRDIYSSDFFENVEILQEENVLIIRIEERPSISDITIEGNKLIPTDALLENMESAGLAIGQVYKPSTMEGMEIALEGQYVQQGLYGASVDVEIDEQVRNRVAININVNEGDASKIVHLNIVGNTVFSDDELLDLFELQTSHLTSFFKKDDRYAREKINGDIERLTSYYMDQGYINFDITSTQVSITPDKEEVYITINIAEGEIYTVKDVELAGDLVNSEGILRLILQVQEGQVFSQQLVTATAEFMTQVLGNQGYFFAEVEGVTSINDDNKEVDVTFFIVPGSRTYVNRISFYGNTNTVDEVLRREMRQMEGAPASNVALEQSKLRLQQLGYFGEVEYETAQVPGTTDQIDVDFTVEEQASGQIGGSIGYADVQGLILTANIQDSNFLGTGKRVGVNVSNNRFSTSYQFNFSDPYYTIDGVSRGFSVSYTSSDYAKLNLASYSTDQFAMNANFSYPLGETQRLGFNFGFTNTHLNTSNNGFDPVQEIKASPYLLPNVQPRYIIEPLSTTAPFADAITAPLATLPATAFNQRQGFIDREGDKFNDFTIGINWSQSTLNLGLFPTAGGSQQLSFESAIPGSDLSFYTIRYIKEHFFPLFGEWIFHFRANLGYGDAFGDTQQLPFFRNFYAGGLGSIRGFERNTLGPRSTIPRTYANSLAFTQYLKNADGSILLNSSGLPVGPDPASPAYTLVPKLDVNGEVIVIGGVTQLDDTLQSTALYQQRDSTPFGGNVQATGTFELLFPMPFIEDRRRVRSGIFADWGNVFSTYCTEEQTRLNNCSDFKLKGFRYSAGVSVSWASGAFGIMTFSLAKPFNTSSIDETEVFQFTIGNSF